MMNETKNKIVEIKELLYKAQDVFDTIQKSEQVEIYDVHVEHASLAHCLRWGLNAAKELSEAQ